MTVSGLYIGKGFFTSFYDLLKFLQKNGYENNTHSFSFDEYFSKLREHKNIDENDDIYYAIRGGVTDFFSKKCNINGVKLINYPHDIGNYKYTVLGIFEHIRYSNPEYNNLDIGSIEISTKLDNINSAHTSKLDNLLNKLSVFMAIPDGCNCCT